MTTKKIVRIVMWIMAGGIALFIFFLYATIKTKSTSLSSYAPFKEWIGETVTLNRETVLCKEKDYLNVNSNYPYTLLDSLHPDWQKVEQHHPDIEPVMVFPAGTKLHIEKAVQYTNGVSGSSYPTMFGTISENGREYRISYRWGERNLALYFDRTKECWYFHQAPWQSKTDTAFYYLPVAEWW
ncbi:hypothetical protein [Niabella aquatica]